MSKLSVCKSPSYDGRSWIVHEDGRIIARFLSHRAALNYALWKSALLPNYGSC